MSDATTFTSIITALGAFGLAGVIGAYFQSRFQQRTKIGEQEHELKQKRYLCILMLMLTKLKPGVGMEKITTIRPDLRDTQDVDDELVTELMNALVYATDDVIESLSAFIETPTSSTFIVAATQMRKDLWGKKTNLDQRFINTLIKVCGQ